MVSSLNEGQFRYLYNFIFEMKSENNPIYDLIIGHAGSGKSRLLTVIYNTLLRLSLSTGDLSASDGL